MFRTESDIPGSHIKTRHTHFKCIPRSSPRSLIIAAVKDQVVAFIY